MQDAENFISYSIDGDDRLRSVNPAFQRFAQANDAPELTEGVAGRPIWDFITGAEVSAVYQELFTRVRTTRRSVSFPYRCDSPAERRDLWMEIGRAHV